MTLSVALPIRTERLTLRTFTRSDTDDILRYHSNAAVARYLLEEPLDRPGAAAKVERHLPQIGLETDARALALAVEHDGVVVGDVTVWLVDETEARAEIGWVFSPDVAGRGLATEAVSALIDALFDAGSLHRLEAQMDGRNESSARLCERLGMTREAHLRQDWWSKGEWTDTVKYGLLATDRES